MSQKTRKGTPGAAAAGPGGDAGAAPGGARRRAGGAKRAAGAGSGPGAAGGADTAPDVPAGPVPGRLLLAAAVAALEGLGLVVWGVTTLAAGGQDILAGILVLALAALPLAAAQGLRRARRWSRGPALIMQLISLPIAWTMVRSDGPAVAVGAVLGVLALLGLAVLVHPATSDALGIDRTAR